jgi:hypothetical protein
MKHYGSMNHFNSPILDFTHINNHIDENDNIDSDIQEILQQGAILLLLLLLNIIIIVIIKFFKIIIIIFTSFYHY